MYTGIKVYVTTATESMDGLNICTNERTFLLTCDSHKHIFVCFEMLPYESELNQKENVTLS